MPSGKIHTLASCVVAGASFPALLFNVGWQEAAICSSGAMIGIILSPDLDCNSGHIGNFYLRKYAGVIVEKVWDVVWYPYRLACPHRGFISHAPGLSTLIRLAYLALWIAPFWWLAGIKMPHWEAWHGWLVLGLILSDTIHWFLDVLDDKVFRGKL